MHCKYVCKKSPLGNFWHSIVSVSISTSVIWFIFHYVVYRSTLKPKVGATAFGRGIQSWSLFFPNRRFLAFTCPLLTHVRCYLTYPPSNLLYLNLDLPDHSAHASTVECAVPVSVVYVVKAKWFVFFYLVVNVGIADVLAVFVRWRHFTLYGDDMHLHIFRFCKHVISILVHSGQNWSAHSRTIYTWNLL